MPSGDRPVPVAAGLIEIVLGCFSFIFGLGLLFELAPLRAMEITLSVVLFAQGGFDLLAGVMILRRRAGGVSLAMVIAAMAAAAVLLILTALSRVQASVLPLFGVGLRILVILWLTQFRQTPFPPVGEGSN